MEREIRCSNCQKLLETVTKKTALGFEVSYKCVCGLIRKPVKEDRGFVYKDFQPDAKFKEIKS